MGVIMLERRDRLVNVCLQIIHQLNPFLIWAAQQSMGGGTHVDSRATSQYALN